MHWQSDAPYDYWSQTKLKTAPANMEDVIRITGKWKEDETSGDLYLEDIAEDGFLYLTPKETRNGLIKAKFKQVNADAPIKFGVGLNYFVESKADAAARLGIDTYEVKDNMLQNNGIFAIYGVHDIGGTDTLGIGVYQVDGTGFHLLSDAGSTPLFSAVDFGLDYYWLQMRFEEGRIKVWYRADTATSWTLAVDDVPVYHADNFPWTYDELGRG